MKGTAEEEEGGGRAAGGGRQLGPSALWEDSQAALENTGCGHAGGENGFRHPPNPTPNRPHTHNSILSIPLLTLSCLSPLSAHGASWLERFGLKEPGHGCLSAIT